MVLVVVAAVAAVVVVSSSGQWPMTKRQMVNGQWSVVSSQWSQLGLSGTGRCALQDAGSDANEPELVPELVPQEKELSNEPRLGPDGRPMPSEKEMDDVEKRLNNPELYMNSDADEAEETQEVEEVEEVEQKDDSPCTASEITGQYPMFICS